MKLHNSLKVLQALLLRDLLTFKKEVFLFIFDGILWSSRMILIWGYIMPLLGISSNYGLFFFLGAIPSVSIFRIMYGLSRLLYDFEGSRFIDYEVTLPINFNLLFLYKAIILSLKFLFLSLIIIPVGFFILSPEIIWENIYLFRFVTILILSNLLFGFVTLWFSGWVKGIRQLSSTWIRYIHTFWIFGCLLFSWKLLYSMFPFWAILDLLNPITYIMEGIRSTMLNTNDYLSFYSCLIVVILYILFFSFHGNYLLKKRLDII